MHNQPLFRKSLSIRQLFPYKAIKRDQVNISRLEMKGNGILLQKPRAGE